MLTLLVQLLLKENPAPQLKAWPFGEGHLTVILVLSMGQRWPRSHQSGQVVSGMSGWELAGLETDRADPASRIGSRGLGEWPARSQGWLLRQLGGSPNGVASPGPSAAGLGQWSADWESGIE